MATDITITREETASKGRYLARIEGQAEEAEMTFSRVSASQVIIDHTGVPDSLRGLGVGVALARHAVEDARTRGFRVVPLCPFFKAQAQRHPDWSDVVTGI